MAKETGLIGIGITTRNRNEVARHTLNQILKYSPVVCKIVVVDDASDVSFEGATYRFDKNVGVGAAKNKCLELLDNCEHILLFDDDCTPIVDEWWLPYINSGLNHSCYTFDRIELNRTQRYVSYENPNGCMLYFTRKCIDMAGGWDTEFSGFGFEHVEISRRIFNMGLTPARFIDVPNSNSLFKMAYVESTFGYQERMETIPINAALYESKLNNKEFKLYK